MHFRTIPDSGRLLRTPISDILSSITARQVYVPEEDDIILTKLNIKDVLYDESRLIISPKRLDNRNEPRSGHLPAIKTQSLRGRIQLFDPDLDAYRFPGAGVVTNERTE